MKKVLLPGVRRGHLTVVRPVSTDRVEVQCDCGAVKETWKTNLYRPEPHCGCKSRNEFRDTYQAAWIVHRHRKRCAGWRESRVFCATIGPPPEEGARLVADGLVARCGQCPECVAGFHQINVTWVSGAEARRTAALRQSLGHGSAPLVVGGAMMLLREVGAGLGISYQAVQQRRAAGWSDERAATAPKGTRVKQYRCKVCGELGHTSPSHKNG